MPEPQLTAALPYLMPTEGKPVYYASSGGVDDQHDIGVRFDWRRVEIRDARRLSPPACPDSQGFQLVPHSTGIADFYALDDSITDYENELRQLVRAATGAAETLVFDHTLRSDSSAIRGDRSTREPAGFIHNDYTDDGARKRLRQLLPAVEAEDRLQRRFAIVNVWRSIEGTVLNSPLTCCDANTLQPADLVAVERRAADRVGELEFVTWNPGHRWYYYPRMTMDEALLIKTCDSVRDGRATRCIHTAFDNPLAPADAPPRESIESRVMVFF